MDEICGKQMSGMGMGGMLIWGLLGLALLVLAVVGPVWLVRNPGNRSASNPSVESAEEILRRRYAAGEIDEDK